MIRTSTWTRLERIEKHVEATEINRSESVLQMGLDETLQALLVVQECLGSDAGTPRKVIRKQTASLLWREPLADGTLDWVTDATVMLIGISPQERDGVFSAIGGYCQTE